MQDMQIVTYIEVTYLIKMKYVIAVCGSSAVFTLSDLFKEQLPPIDLDKTCYCIILPSGCCTRVCISHTGF